MTKSYDDIRSIEDLHNAIGEAQKDENLAALQDLERFFIPADRTANGPFVPAIALKESEFETKLSEEESNLAVELANSLERAKRRTEYRIKIAAGYDGPIIVSEGDSWFQYPFFLTDIIDNVMDEYAVFSLGGAGHLLSDIVAVDEYTSAIVQENADYLLFSAGGNDMVGDGRLAEFIRPYQSNMSPQDIVNKPAFDQFKRSLSNLLFREFTRLTQHFPELTILIHGYDYVLPRSIGKWLGEPLRSRNVPENLWGPVMAIFIDEFNEEIGSLASRIPGRVIHVDCRNQVGDHINSWADEIHPRNAGFERLSARFLEHIRSQPQAAAAAPVGAASAPLSREEFRKIVRGPVSPGSPEFAERIMVQSMPAAPRSNQPAIAMEAIIGAPTIAPPPGPAVLPGAVVPIEDDALDASDEITVEANAHPCSSVAVWRTWLDEEDIEAYQHYAELIGKVNEPDSHERLESRRELSSGRTLERIINESNIFPINFLSRGRRAARAVGRISVVSRFGISLGTGTGFLIAPGLLLTNHHVLREASEVSNSYILFDYEFDEDNAFRQTEMFNFTPDIFLTDEELDFSIVSVAQMGRNGKNIVDYGHLPLIRQSGKAIKTEPVSIIQHAEGSPKQIAMRDSRIIGRKNHYIYYTTDTNPGSSGAPVVNDDWLPVALHHRSVPDFNNPCQYVANRGIRISSIVEHLDNAADNGDVMAQTVINLIEQNTMLSPSRISVRPGVFDPDGTAATEALREPFHELPYDNRKGYDEVFLGFSVPLPTVKDPDLVSKLIGTDEHVIPYEHFSAVLHKTRRLALFTASNVNAHPDKLKPEPGDYTRKALNGYDKDHKEKWFKDPRIPSEDQLPDRFFEKDNKAFDKGHIVRRNDVIWGNSYKQIQRANGDTFHTVNCSPQVKGFNRSSLSGIWGKLENMVLKQAKTEQLTVFAGPVLDSADQSFRGKDDQGEILVQIPSKYWKVVVATEGDSIESFAFILEQDLSDVALEFQADAQWREHMISISALETLVRHFTFPDVIHQSDQAHSDHGESLRRLESMELFA